MIKNIINNNCYIGSTINFQNRARRHFNSLERKDHHSLYLQRAWNKYGKNNFIFEIIRLVNNKNKLEKIEQKFLDKIKPVYNISKLSNKSILSKEGRKRIGLAKSKTYIITYPNNKEKTIKNLRQFCFKHKLSSQLMCHVCSGKQSNHKGYKCRYINDKKHKFKFKINLKTYLIKFNNKIIKTNMLHKFCVQNNLNYSHMIEVSKNIRKHHKGYICKII